MRQASGPASRVWASEVANQRVHGTTHEQVARWGEERSNLQPVNGIPAYSYRDDEQRKVARDAYVAWQRSPYSVPREYACEEVWVAGTLNSAVHKGHPVNRRNRRARSKIHMLRPEPQGVERALAAHLA